MRLLEMNDWFGFPGRRPRSLFGFDIVESPDIPRYTLPKEVMPGVPWPPGFRDEINQWSRSFIGTTNVVPINIAYVFGSTVIMRPNDICKLSDLT